MDTLHLEFADPKTIILAARGSAESYQAENDQVWELEFNDHNVHPISLYTSYGLRAREMRIFPSLTINNKRVSGLRDYATPPALTRYLPDAFRAGCSPVDGLDIVWEGFFRDCDTLVGTLTIANHSNTTFSITLALAALLVPMRKGAPMHAEKDGINQILTGQSGDLHPVLFMTGGPQVVISPYPSLVIPIELASGQTRRLTWALVTKDSSEASLAAARRISAFDWRAAVMEKTLEQERQTLQIHTGDPDWDAAFFLSQVQARIHAVRPKAGSAPVFLQSRLPDAVVFSEESELTLLEILHLHHVLTPTDPICITDLLEGCLGRITENGTLPSRFYGTNQNNPIRECPVLAWLFLLLYEYDLDLSRLEKAFPLLCRFFDNWFTLSEDPEEIHWPAWDDPQQIQCDTGVFNFDVWEETSLGLDISWALSPALLAMLSNEANALRRIAKLLKDRTAQKKYKEINKTLHNKLQSTWNEKFPGFSYLDLQSFQAPDRELYFPGRIQPKLIINKVFLKPQRLLLHLTSSDENTRVCRLTINGVDLDGNHIREVIKSHQLRWVMGRSHVTTAHCYQSIDSLEIEGLKTGDRFLLETANFTQPDITCLLPIWSGDITDEQCTMMVENFFNPKTLDHRTGLPETWETGHSLPKELPIESNILWNTLIITGLLKTGQQESAVSYFTNIMKTIVNGLRDFAGFFSFYKVDNSQPIGKRNNLSGLAPMQLFLALTGIRIFSPKKVAVWGRNPFPWPVDIHWQGLSIRREGSETLIIFPDGSRYQEKTKKPVILTMNAE